MAVPSFISAVATGSATGSVTSAAIDTTGATQLRVFVITQQVGNPSVSDSKANTWALDGTSTLLNGTFTAYVTCWKCTPSSVGTGHTFSATGTTAASILAIAVGPSNAGALSASTWNAQTDATSPYVSPSVTPSSADALLVTFGASDSSGAAVTTDWSANSFTSRASITDHNSFWGGSVATRAVTTSASYASSFTDSGTGAANSVVGIIAFTEAGAAPSITAQPANQRVSSGQTAAFSVSATASGGSLTYQWQTNATGAWVNIGAATSSSYTTPTLTAGQAYGVRCVVTDSNGSTNSDSADIWVPARKTPPWAGGRAGGRDLLRAATQWPNSKTAARIYEDALFGQVVASETTITCSVGNAAAAGPTATINAARVIPAAPGNATATGVTSAIDQQRIIAAPPANAAANGAQAAISRSVLTSPANAVADGPAATIQAAITVACSVGNSAASGARASIGISVVTAPANATATGVQVAIATGATVSTTPANASATGVTAAADQARSVSATPANAVATGASAAISVSVAAQPANAVAAGVTASVRTDLTVLGQPANATATGVTAGLDQARTIAAAPANASAAGVQASVGNAVVISAAPANAAAAGAQASVAVSVGAGPANAVADGAKASINGAISVQAQPANAVADGQTARIDQQRVIASTPAGAQASGAQASIDRPAVVQAGPANAVAAGVAAAVSFAQSITCTPAQAVAEGVTATIIAQGAQGESSGGSVSNQPPQPKRTRIVAQPFFQQRTVKPDAPAADQIQGSPPPQLPIFRGEPAFAPLDAAGRGRTIPESLRTREQSAQALAESIIDDAREASARLSAAEVGRITENNRRARLLIALLAVAE
jgi:hypothetical protein